MNAIDKARAVREILGSKKGEQIAILDVGSLTSITDYFVFATARNTPHLKALADEVIFRLKRDQGVPCYRRAGEAESGWIVVDYIDVVLHLFTDRQRAYYGLEDLWGDADRVE